MRWPLLLACGALLALALAFLPSQLLVLPVPATPSSAGVSTLAAFQPSPPASPASATGALARPQEEPALPAPAAVRSSEPIAAAAASALARPHLRPQPPAPPTAAASAAPAAAAAPPWTPLDTLLDADPAAARAAPGCAPPPALCTPSDYFDEVLVLSLPRHAARAARLAAQLAALRLAPYTLLQGRDARAPELAALAAAALADPLRSAPGNLAHYSSLLALLEHAGRLRASARVLLLEDDATFAADFPAAFDASARELQGRNWSAWWLGWYGGPAAVAARGGGGGASALATPSERVQGSFALALAPHAARALALAMRGGGGAAARGRAIDDPAVLQALAAAAAAEGGGEGQLLASLPQLVSSDIYSTGNSSSSSSSSSMGAGAGALPGSDFARHGGVGRDRFDLWGGGYSGAQARGAALRLRAPHCPVYEQGVDYFGHEVGGGGEGAGDVLPAPTPSHCCGLCVADWPRCRAWTHWAGGGRGGRGLCFLKSAAALGARVASAGRVSGTVSAGEWQEAAGVAEEEEEEEAAEGGAGGGGGGGALAAVARAAAAAHRAALGALPPLPPPPPPQPPLPQPSPLAPQDITPLTPWPQPFEAFPPQPLPYDLRNCRCTLPGGGSGGGRAQEFSGRFWGPAELLHAENATCRCTAPGAAEYLPCPRSVTPRYLTAAPLQPLCHSHERYTGYESCSVYCMGGGAAAGVGTAAGADAEAVAWYLGAPCRAPDALPTPHSLALPACSQPLRFCEGCRVRGGGGARAAAPPPAPPPLASQAEWDAAAPVVDLRGLRCELLPAGGLPGAGPAGGAALAGGAEQCFLDDPVQGRVLCPAYVTSAYLRDPPVLAEGGGEGFGESGGEGEHPPPPPGAIPAATAAACAPAAAAATYCTVHCQPGNSAVVWRSHDAAWCGARENAWACPPPRAPLASLPRGGSYAPAPWSEPRAPPSRCAAAAAAGVALAPLEGLALGILTHEPTALAATLATYHAHGLFALAAQVLVYLQNRSPELEGVVAPYVAAYPGLIEVLGSAGNVGIAAGVNALARGARETHLLLLERDFWLVEPGACAAEQLAAGLALLRSGRVHAVRYRHRVRAGRPNWAEDFYRGHEADVFTSRQPNLACNLHYWVNDTERRYPDKFEECGRGPRFVCSDSADCNWTNNPVLFSVAWWLAEYAPRLGAAPSDEIEWFMHSGTTEGGLAVWNERRWTVAQGEGLFMHVDATKWGERMPKPVNWAWADAP